MVNNAGIEPEFAPIWSLDLDRWHQLHNVAGNGVFYGTRVAGTQMMKQEPHENGDRGWIVNTCSTYSFLAVPNGCE